MPVMYKNTEWGPKVVDNTRLAVIVDVTVVARCSATTPVTSLAHHFL